MELKSLGGGLLPVVFEIIYDRIEFEIVRAANTVIVNSDDLDVLEKLKKDRNRTYGKDTSGRN